MHNLLSIIYPTNIEENRAPTGIEYIRDKSLHYQRLYLQRIEHRSGHLQTVDGTPIIKTIKA